MMQHLGRAISVTLIATGFDRRENSFKEAVAIAGEEIKLDIEKNEAEPVAKAPGQKTIFDEINELGTEDLERKLANKKVEEMKQRMRYLKDLNYNANRQDGNEELENVPAYLRKGVKLDDHPHSSDEGVI